MTFANALRNGLNMAGGAFYHYSAFRFQKKLWQPYVQELNDWLKQWNPNSDRLLLVGPSAGYSLKYSFLRQFKQVDCVDPDPLAALFFRRRFPRKKVHWHHYDYFSTLRGPFQPEGLKHMLGHFSDHTILFCNFLGQVPLLAQKNLADEEFNTKYSQWKTLLNSSLKGRSWASYHDLFSVVGKNITVDTHFWKGQSMNPSPIDQMAEQGLSGDGVLQVTDHLTQKLFDQGQKRLYIPWQRVPDHLHIIEAIQS